MTLTATPASGDVFLGWGGACSGTSTCEISAADGLLVTAAFGAASSATISYYHTDVLGSVRAITNDSGGMVIRQDYFPFGESGATMAGDPRRFTGKERDAETVFDYFDARYYRNLWGRFTTIDPGQVSGDPEDPQGWNAYAYGRNNPLRFVDPTGTEYQVCQQGGRCVNGIEDASWKRARANPGPGITLIGDEYSGWIYYHGAAWGWYEWIGPDRTTEGAILGAFQTAGVRSQAGLKAIGRELVAEGIGALVGTSLRWAYEAWTAARAGQNIVGVARILSTLQKGRNTRILTVGSTEELQQLFGRLAAGGRQIPSGAFPGRMIQLSDGTRVGLRCWSLSGGQAVDVTLPSGVRWVIHIR